MKIAVYTIAKNEAQFVERWAASCADADYRIILDTGSTDGTVALAEAAGVDVHVQVIDPWRFDVARNASMALVPDDADYCISLDMDEVLIPGWREALEGVPAEVTRPRYEYTWSWNEDGTPGLQYGGDKIHARHGYQWKHPVHEVMHRTDDKEEIQSWIDLKIHHFPDNSKSRGQYLPLLALAVEEDPDDDRNAFYYARELVFNRRFDEAVVEFKRHLALDSAVWRPERSASMRYLGKLTDDITWFEKATEESPERREPWVDLADARIKRKDLVGALAAAKRALAITEKPLEYLCESDDWSWRPFDIAALASYYMGDFTGALEYGRQALEATTPFEAPRLEANVNFYTEAIEAYRASQKSIVQKS